MITFFIVKERGGQRMLATGRELTYTYNVNTAKHFTSRWAAENWLKRAKDADLFTVVRIERW